VAVAAADAAAVAVEAGDVVIEVSEAPGEAGSGAPREAVSEAGWGAAQEGAVLQMLARGGFAPEDLERVDMIALRSTGFASTGFASTGCASTGCASTGSRGYFGARDIAPFLQQAQGERKRKCPADE
jgi:hypothetical protein